MSKHNDYLKYDKEYKEESFWDKISENFKVIGQEAIGKALQLYYATQHPDCTATDKAVIYGALGYLISPIDAIPDFTPVLGYTDDIAVIGAALYTVSKLIDDGVKAKAEAKLKDWFG